MSAPRYSSRVRLLLSLLVSMLLILGTVGYVANEVSQHETDEVFSARLATSARVLEALVAGSLEIATVEQPIVIRLPPELERGGGDKPNASGHPYESKIAFQVWNSEGKLLARSNTSPADSLGPQRPGFHEHRVGNELWKVFSLQSGKLWVFAAERNEVREELADEISLSILTPLAIGGIVLLVVVNLLALQAIKPVEALALGISRRDPASLEPIALPGAPSELEPVIRELNELLTRVQEAMSREQRFIDSAVHELRTPIAAVQLHVQNAMAADNPRDKESSLQDALAASRRVTRLAEQLLDYSRVSASAGMEERGPINLRELCLEAAAMLRPILDRRQQRLEILDATDAVIVADKGRLERVVRNLVDNASQYGATPGVIGLSVRKAGDRAELVVENEGKAIPEQEKGRIFIPYYRALGSDSFGSGLGLAIVQEIVNQHHGSIRVEDKSPGNGTRVTVAFPA